MNDVIKDKIKGVFYGQAIGDALGLATEFMTKEEVKTFYPKGLDNYNQIIQDKHRSRWIAGNWTDDTDQFICILTSLIEHKKVVPLDIAQNFYDWMEGDGMGIGMTTYSVLTMPQYTEFPYKGSELVWKMKRRDIAPNGALMRNSIVCLYKYWELDQVLDNCESIAKLTHHDPRCVDSCKIMAHIIYGELIGEPLTYSNINSLTDSYDPRIEDYLTLNAENVDDLVLDDPSSIGYTLKALNAGLWAYFNGTTFRESLLSIIMAGGDADTNGCIAGSMLGAKYGFSSIPPHWIEGLNERSKLENFYLDFLDLLIAKKKI